MSINLIAPGSVLPTATLIADSGANNATPTMTKVNGVTVNASLEVQSTEGAFLMPRMTTTERDALVTVVDGMQIYNSTDTQVQLRVNDAWEGVGGAAGGPVQGPGASTVNAIARWGNVGGTSLKDTDILISNLNDITAINSTEVASGSSLLPGYSFAANTVGLYSSNPNTLDVATNDLRAFQFASAPAVSVNYLVATPSTAGVSPKLSAAGTDVNVSVGVSGKGTGGLDILASSGASAGKATFWNGAGTFNTSLAAGVNAANLGLTLPIVDASANASATSIQVPLSSNGAGVLSFANTTQRYMTKTLTAANILAMFTTPISVIAAPGAGFAVVIDSVALQLIYNTTTYAIGGAVYLQYGVTAHGANFASDAAGIPAVFVQGTASAIIRANGTINTTTGLGTAVAANAAVTITNDTAVFTTGNSTALLHIAYRIVAIT